MPTLFRDTSRTKEDCCQAFVDSDPATHTTDSLVEACRAETIEYDFVNMVCAVTTTFTDPNGNPLSN